MEQIHKLLGEFHTVVQDMHGDVQHVKNTQAEAVADSSQHGAAIIKAQQNTEQHLHTLNEVFRQLEDVKEQLDAMKAAERESGGGGGGEGADGRVLEKVEAIDVTIRNYITTFERTLSTSVRETAHSVSTLEAKMDSMKSELLAALGEASVGEGGGGGTGWYFVLVQCIFIGFFVYWKDKRDRDIKLL